MMSALFYLQAVSTRNRLVARVKRLRQPKYLFGAIVGGLYFYFYFFRWMLGSGGARQVPPMVATGDTAGLRESIGAVILFLVVLAAWVLPNKRAALIFTEAEIAFLFPAPISRRALIHFKLLRSQFAILFGVFFFTLISMRFGGGGRGLIRAAGWWIILSTLNLHTLGGSFLRTLWLDRGLSNWKRRILFLTFAFGLVTWVVIATKQSFPELRAEDVTNPAALTEFFEKALTAGPLPWVLAPFRLVVRPYLSANWTEFATVLWPAALLLFLHYLWVIRSNVAFEEASVEASQKLAEKVAAVRAGNYQAAKDKPKRRRNPFPLGPIGAPFVALLWKNLINAGSAFTMRFAIILGAIVLGMSFGMKGVLAESGIPGLIAFFSAILAGWSLFFGPQVLRYDFRQEMPMMDVLKSYPLRNWQVALGQLLAPAVLLTAFQWLCLVVAVVLGSRLKLNNLTPLILAGAGLGAALLCPMLNVVSLIIPNAAVLLFPAWFQTGKEGPHGIEVQGQRIIFALGQFFVMLLALVPSGLVFFISFLLSQLFFPLWIVLPLCAAASAIVLAGEAALGIFLLGKLFAKFDLSSEPAA